MSQTLSPSSARCYGLARVARVWTIARASVYRSLKETPPNTIARRPGPVGACSDAELADHMGSLFKDFCIQSERRSHHQMLDLASWPCQGRVSDGLRTRPAQSTTYRQNPTDQEWEVVNNLGRGTTVAKYELLPQRSLSDATASLLRLVH